MVNKMGKKSEDFRLEKLFQQLVHYKWKGKYSHVSIKQASSFNFFEKIFHPARLTI